MYLNNTISTKIHDSYIGMILRSQIPAKSNLTINEILKQEPFLIVPNSQTKAKHKH
jgi:hypothetical protein